MSLYGLTTFVVALSAALQAVSQGSNITCGSQYAWMTNSRGQNPCVVSAYLEGACMPDPTQAYFYPLKEGFYYWSPWKDDETPCTCNTVYFSTLAACMACQNEESFEQSSPWSTWTMNCSTTAVGRWPTQVPAGTAIPSWAFLDVVRSDRFNVTLAKIVAAQDSPDTTLVPSAQPTSTSAPTASQAAQTTTTTGRTNKTNAGAIAGAAVGALILGGTIIGAIVFFCRTKRRRGVWLEQIRSASNVRGDSEKTLGVQQTQDPLLKWVPYDPKNSATFPSGTVHTPMSSRDARFTGLPEI